MQSMHLTLLRQLLRWPLVVHRWIQEREIERARGKKVGGDLGSCFEYGCNKVSNLCTIYVSPGTTIRPQSTVLGGLLIESPPPPKNKRTIKDEFYDN